MTRHRTTTTTRIASLLLVAALAACSDDADGDATEAASGAPSTSAPAEAAETEPTVAEASSDAAAAFVASLDAEQRAAAVLPFDPAALPEGWAFGPTPIAERPGVKLGDLTADQQEQAMALLDAVLSAHGEQVARDVMAEEDDLAARIADPATPRPDLVRALEDMAAEQGVPLYGGDEYFVALYGDPSADEPWAFQMSGHHYARTVVVDGDRVTTTPYFVGSEGNELRTDDRIAAAFDLLATLDDAQLQRAQLPEPHGEVVRGPGHDDAVAPVGLPVAELDDARRQALLGLVGRWLADAESATTDGVLARYEAELDDTTIAYAGPTDPSALGAYLRIQGPSLWLEIATPVANAGEGVHHHTLLRDVATDHGGRS